MPKQTDSNPNTISTPQQKTESQILGRPDIPTLFIDKFLLTKRPDSNILFNGIQSVPGFEAEQLRLMISNDHAKRFVEKLAQLIDFYPEKPPVPSTSSKKVKTAKASGNRGTRTASQKSKKQVSK